MFCFVLIVYIDTHRGGLGGKGGYNIGPHGPPPANFQKNCFLKCNKTQNREPPGNFVPWIFNLT